MIDIEYILLRKNSFKSLKKKQNSKPERIFIT